MNFINKIACTAYDVKYTANLLVYKLSKVLISSET